MMLFAVPLLAPALLAAAAVFLHFRDDISARQGAVWAERVAALVLLITFASLGVLLAQGPGDSALIGVAGAGLSARLDTVSVTMLILVAFIGWIVVRYSRTYLDGETRQSFFTIWLLATLAAVLLLVQSGNLVQFVVAWIGTSLCLHRLLLFYPGRIGAHRAARKKFVTARAGDAALIGAGDPVGRDLWHHADIGDPRAGAARRGRSAGRVRRGASRARRAVEVRAVSRPTAG